MKPDQFETDLRIWFRQDLPPEPASLHAIPSAVAANRSSKTPSRHMVRSWGWAGAGSLGLVASVLALAVVGSVYLAGAGSSPTRTALVRDPGQFRATTAIPGQGWDTATVLRDGSVLITRAQPPAGDQSNTVAGLYIPSSDQFRPLASGALADGRTSPTATELLDGRVLIAGGRDASGEALASAVLFDPATSSFSSTGQMTTGRTGQTATQLRDGRVLLAGGRTGPAVVGESPGIPGILPTAEIYDPEAGRFSSTGRMAAARTDAAAARLPDGRVLILGGAGPTQLASAEVFDANLGSFAPTGTMAVGRQGPTATVLANGRVLVGGGWSIDGSLASAELYDPKVGAFAPTGTMRDHRYRQSATLLPDGSVLVTGGLCGDTADPCLGPAGGLSSAELYDGNSGTFVQAAAMTQPRYGHVTALLSDGRVLVLGGQSAAGMAQTADLFEP